jgi:PEP-CTERM motif.
VYIEYEGQLAKVIAQGDTLDGKVVNSTAMSSDALSGNRLAFFASFSDGSEGVYVATAVPEASEAAMLLAGLGVIGVIAHRRRQINDVV